MYSTSLDFIQPLNNKKNLLTSAPSSIKSNKEELASIYKTFNLPTTKLYSESVTSSQIKTVNAYETIEGSNLKSQLKKGIVPNLNGLSAKDALFLLENSGFNVTLFGMGSVKKQSLEVGKKFNKGDKITLILS